MNQTQQKGPLEKQKTRSAFRAQSSTKELFPQRSMRSFVWSCGLALIPQMCVSHACVCVPVMKCGYCCCCCVIITNHVMMTQQILYLTPSGPPAPPASPVPPAPRALPALLLLLDRLLHLPSFSSCTSIFHCCKFILTSVIFYHPPFF